MSRHRFQTEYTASKSDQVKRLKELAKENERLRKAVFDLTLEKLILREAACGNARAPAAAAASTNVMRKFDVPERLARRVLGHASAAHWSGRASASLGLHVIHEGGGAHPAGLARDAARALDGVPALIVANRVGPKLA